MIGKRWIIGCWIAVMGGCLMACAPQAVREAQSVVAQADSLWHAGKQYGIDEGDSATLAQAYETLGQWQWLHTDEYAHACYHYGKLLRAKGNPAAAMQAFISATHSGTKDYHILGRVYSNMGDLCHLANEFQLSYDMFAYASELFLLGKDTISYYYTLNNSAFEKACLSEKDSCYIILQTIRRSNTKQDSLLIAYSYLTQARSCMNAQLYDSAIYYAQRAYSYKIGEPTIVHTIAQAYSYMGVKDSATHYAMQVVNNNPPLNELANALYILTNDDETKDKNAIREIAASRSDTQKLLEIRQGKLSQAVQLLDQDLHRKPDYRWLYTILLTLVVGSACLYVYNYRKRRQHALLSQQVDDLAIQNKEAEAQHEKITGDIEKHKRTITNEIEQNCQLIIKAESFPQNIYWKDFNKMRAVIDCQFYMIATKLSKKNVLNETEIRLCILVLLNLSRVDISKTLPYASSSVGKLKDQTAKKLNTTGKNLRDYLIKMAVE